MPTKKVLIAVTSHAQLGSTGRPTGYYLSEVSHPYFELLGRGFSVDFVSPQGGKPPMDPGSLTNVDPASARFAATPEIMLRLNASLSPASVQSEGYAAMLFAGGHGTMWDFADDAGLSRLAREIYERGGALAAVCHGPAALVNLKLSDGSYLVQGKRLAAFTEAEERAAELDGVVPFPLAALLVERGAVHEAAEPWQSKVVVDGRLVTGQNPGRGPRVGRNAARSGTRCGHVLAAHGPRTSGAQSAPTAGDTGDTKSGRLPLQPFASKHDQCRRVLTRSGLGQPAATAALPSVAPSARRPGRASGALELRHQRRGVGAVRCSSVRRASLARLRPVPWSKRYARWVAHRAGA
jgi:putative intracellular protease/amidase